MADVRFVEASRIYPGTDAPAVDALDLHIADGEFVVLVGPSGSGKTTALRMLAGLEEVDAGAVLIGGRDVTDLAPKRRDVAMVFQNYALYPYLTVEANIAFPLRIAKVKKSERARRVREVAELLGLTEYLQRKPGQLSGGQRQRVAMGRAIVREPSVFLMDEPLSNLDAKLRVGMRASLAQLHSRLGTTTVYVTHDQVEAMTLGQRVAVMRNGRMLQVDRPQRLYEQPRDLFVAAFIGSPAMNLVEATLTADEVVFGQFRVPLDPRRQPSAPSGSGVVLGIRPEAFEDAELAASGLPTIEVRVEVAEELGSDAHLLFPVEAQPVTAELLEAAEADQAGLLVTDSALFTARVDARTRARAGATVRLAVDPGRFHFFDPDSGASLRPQAVAEAMATAS
jgi:multiple sugar transport system ATP-binding protein